MGASVDVTNLPISHHFALNVKGCNIINQKMPFSVGFFRITALFLLILGCANARQEIDNELDSEIQVLQKVKEKLAGKNYKDLADMMDTDKDGKLTNTEMKNGLCSLTGNTELDEIANDELDLLFDNLKDDDGNIDVSGSQVTDRLGDFVFPLIVRFGIPLAVRLAVPLAINALTG